MVRQVWPGTSDAPALSRWQTTITGDFSSKVIASTLMSSDQKETTCGDYLWLGMSFPWSDSGINQRLTESICHAASGTSSSNTVGVATLAGLAVASIVLLGATAACICCRPKKAADEEAAKSLEEGGTAKSNEGSSLGCQTSGPSVLSASSIKPRSDSARSHANTGSE